MFLSPASPSQHPGYPVGAGTFSTTQGATSNTIVNAVDTIYFYPFLLPQPVTFTAAQLRVNTAGTGSSIKTGIWANGTNASANRPVGAPLFADNTGVVTTSVGNVAIPIAGTLQPGLIWIGTKHTGSPLPVVQSIAASNNYSSWLVGWVGSALFSTGFTFADAYANNMPTLATNATFTLHANATPLIGLTV